MPPIYQIYAYEYIFENDEYLATKLCRCLTFNKLCPKNPHSHFYTFDICHKTKAREFKN